MRGDDRVGDHLQRFQLRGTYAQMVLLDYRVIDFRYVPSSGRIQSVKDEKLIRVYLRPDDCKLHSMVSTKGKVSF